MTLMFTE